MAGQLGLMGVDRKLVAVTSTSSRGGDPVLQLGAGEVTQALTGMTRGKLQIDSIRYKIDGAC